MAEGEKTKKEMVMKRQEMFTRCIICKWVTGCYVSDRQPQKKYCHQCNEFNCPIVTPDTKYSSGYCLDHFEQAMKELDNRKQRLLPNQEVIEPAKE